MAPPFPCQLPGRSPLTHLSLHWLCFQLPIWHHSWSHRRHHCLDSASAGTHTARGLQGHKKGGRGSDFCVVRLLLLSEVSAMNKAAAGKIDTLYDESFGKVRGLRSREGVLPVKRFPRVMFLSHARLSLLRMWCCSTNVDPAAERIAVICLLTLAWKRLVVYYLRFASTMLTRGAGEGMGYYRVSPWLEWEKQACFPAEGER